MAPRDTSGPTYLSFPQLKYPSLRDQGPKDAAQWLTGKALDDGAEGLWRVYDKLYDVQSFIGQHPGGRDWLELTKGTDITEAFEVHHLNPSVKTTLEKYYVRDATEARNSPFTFHKDGFYMTLKDKIRDELKKVPANALRGSARITDGILGMLVLSAWLACWLQDTRLSLLATCVAGLALCWLTICTHNYLHEKDNWRMYLFNLSLMSYRDWRISHVLSHHLFPNMLIDLEISTWEPMFQWLPDPKKPKWTRLAFLFGPLLYWIQFPLGGVRKAVLAVTREGFFRHHCHWHDLVGFSLPLYMWVFSGAPLMRVLEIWFIIIAVSSFIFTIIGLHAAHHHPDIFHDGDEPRSEILDWGIHQLDSVMDRVEINGSLFRVMTNFGDHGLHHLFPTVDHACLPYLYQVFLEHCELHRVNFRMTSQFDLIIGHHRQIARTTRKSFKID